MDLNEYNSLTKQALQYYFCGLNDMQKRAVFQIDGPLLILAGAGSGKTTVLISRIENMIRFGNAYHAKKMPVRLDEESISFLQKFTGNIENGGERLSQIISQNRINPWNILAITFTNKAAGELKSRLSQRLGKQGEDVRASTFHSLCTRILRSEIGLLGYSSNFTIYDTDDSVRIIKSVMSELNIDDKILAPKAVLSAIGRAKDNLTTPMQMLEIAASDFRMNSIAKIYDLYQKRLKMNNALDFDDIIVGTVELFRQNPEVLEKYQNRFKYIMVDEYQDTNHAQYLLVGMLAAKHKNLCVVGDDDQSIYKFRGATIENILNFEKQFANATVIRLEQNYRSTQNILNAANSVISNNLARKGKNLWTGAGDGEKILYLRTGDEIEESRSIADSILEHVKSGAKFSDHAILYRMNAQANSLEKSLANNAVPYRIVGGLRFFERKEIKDIIAYLSVINNVSDELRVLRIINEPKRGIGNATLSSAQEIAHTLGVDLFEVIENAGDYAPLSKKSSALSGFTALIRDLIETSETKTLDVLIDEIFDKTGYMRMLQSEGFEGVGRIENILEFKSNVVKYISETEEPTLDGFLEEISLYTDLDNYDTEADSVTLMTVHSAKGLEFRYVYIAGMDEGVFPGRMAMASEAELEEERRLAYVAITRAKEILTILSAERRLIFGQTTFNRPSRFIAEIPPGVVETKDSTSKPVKRAESKVYAKPSNPYSQKTGIGSGSKAAQNTGSTEKINVGDRVSHKVFGDGTVVSAKPMASDMLLEINFDKAGVKKIMANFARLALIG